VTLAEVPTLIVPSRYSRCARIGEINHPGPTGHSLKLLTILLISTFVTLTAPLTRASYSGGSAVRMVGARTLAVICTPCVVGAAMSVVTVPLLSILEAVTVLSALITICSRPDVVTHIRKRSVPDTGRSMIS